MKNALIGLMEKLASELIDGSDASGKQRKNHFFEGFEKGVYFLVSKGRF